MSDWLNTNSHIAYPFVYNPDAEGLEPSEIVDAQFIILSDKVTAPTVWLRSNDNGNYIFSCDGLPDIVFKTDGLEKWSTIWASPEDIDFQDPDTDPTWYGMITIGISNS